MTEHILNIRLFVLSVVRRRLKVLKRIVGMGNSLKLYIAVLDDFPDYMTPTLVAHSVLSAHLKFQNIPTYQKWLNDSFKKCVVRVNSKEFEKISELENVHLGHENNTMGGQKTCVVVCPIEGEQPNVLKFAKLWKPKDIL